MFVFPDLLLQAVRVLAVPAVQNLAPQSQSSSTNFKIPIPTPTSNSRTAQGTPMSQLGGCLIGSQIHQNAARTQEGIQSCGLCRQSCSSSSIIIASKPSGSSAGWQGPSRVNVEAGTCGECRLGAFSSEVDTGSRSNQACADCVNLSAQKTRQNKNLELRF
jgi:hypothetical protein